MLKDMSYKDKFQILEPFLLGLFSSVKKDLKKEHFKINPEFFHTHFKGKFKAKITVAELKSVYTEQIIQGNEDLANYIANRFVSKKMDLYDFFADHLSSLDSNFEKIDSIPEDLAKKWIDESLERFSAKDVYIFVILNSVVFSESSLKLLHDLALNDGK